MARQKTSEEGAQAVPAQPARRKRRTMAVETVTKQAAAPAEEPAAAKPTRRTRRTQAVEAPLREDETMAAATTSVEEAALAQAAMEQPVSVLPSVVPRKPRSVRHTVLRPALLQIQGSPLEESLEEDPVRRSARPPRPRAVSPDPREVNAEGGRKQKRKGGQSQGMPMEDEGQDGALRPRRVSFAPHERKQEAEEDGRLQPDTAYRRRRGAKADMRSRKHRVISQTRITLVRSAFALNGCDPSLNTYSDCHRRM